jgi:hypothetical protein
MADLAALEELTPLGSTQEDLRRVVRDFAAKEVAPIVADANRNEHFPRDRVPVEVGRELVVEADLGEVSERDCIVQSTISYSAVRAYQRVLGSARYVVLERAKQGDA